MDIDSVEKSFSKSIKKSIKFLRNRNDTSFLLIGYDKYTHDVLGVSIALNKSFKSAPLTMGQYHYLFLPGNMLLIKVTADHSDNKHVGRAKYLFQNGLLVSKKQDKYIERDFSSLFSNAALYRQVATEYVKQKFTD
jgi:hypothetical protein